MEGRGTLAATYSPNLVEGVFSELRLLEVLGPRWSELRAEGERVDRVVGFIASVEGVLLVLVGGASQTRIDRVYLRNRLSCTCG